MPKCYRCYAEGTTKEHVLPNGIKLLKRFGFEETNVLNMQKHKFFAI